jgi:hypothetical protein
LAESLESQFQSVHDLSDAAFREKTDEAVLSYEYAPTSEPPLITPSEVIKANK